MSPSTIHEMWISRLVDRGAKTTGWRKALRELDPDLETVAIPDRRPDAYFIDSEACRVSAYEVEIGLPLSEVRLLEWADLWMDLDTFSIDLQLFVVDRFGSVTEVPLQHLWYTASFHKWGRAA